MIPATQAIILELSRTNFHHNYKVGVPDKINLAQLYRWLVLGFTPLPRSIEVQLGHLPVFDYSITWARLKIISDEIIIKTKDFLGKGILTVRGHAQDQEVLIPPDYWQLPLLGINWHDSTTDIDIFSIRVASGAGNDKNKEIIDDYKARFKTLSYSDVTFLTDDVVQVFDGQEITGGYILQLKKQIEERALPTTKPLAIKGKVGAKPRYDWAAYRKHFDDLIDFYGMPNIDEPELKNQAAIERNLADWGAEQYGEAPSPQQIRRYVSKWLATLSAHN